MLFISTLFQSWLFWMIVGPLLFGLFCWELEAKESSTTATFVLIVTLAGLEFFTNLGPVSFVFSHPLQSLWMAGAYLLLGIGYVWIKWFSFVHKAVRKRNDWIAANPTTFASTRYNNDPNEVAFVVGYQKFPLQVKDYKGAIFGWMFYWPVSATWTLLNDPIKRIFDAVYDYIGGSLQRMSDKAFK